MALFVRTGLNKIRSKNQAVFLVVRATGDQVFQSNAFFFSA